MLTNHDRRGLTSSSYIPTLDGWRAVAIIAVILCHGLQPIFATNGPCPSARLAAYVANGAVGVDIFFVLSGYLIASRLLTEYSKSGEISLRTFYIRRAFRIFPPLCAYFAVLGVGAIIGVWKWPALDLLTSLTLTRNYLPSDAGTCWYTGHIWSLSVEEHFYLLWPLILVCAGARRALSVSIAGTIAVAIWAVVETKCHFLDAVLPGARFEYRTDIRIGGLLCGTAGAMLGHRIASVARAGALGWLFGLGLVVAIIVKKPIFGGLLLNLVLLWLITSTAFQPASLIGRALELPVVRWIGRISYSLYIWQQLFLTPAELSGGLAQSLPSNLVCAVGCAVLSFYAVELPMIRVGRRLTNSVSPGRRSTLHIGLPASQPV